MDKVLLIAMIVVAWFVTFILILDMIRIKIKDRQDRQGFVKIDPVMYESLKPFLAGFDLAGKRLPDGNLESYLYSPYPRKVIMKDWPKKVGLFGNTYTLEEIIKGNDGYESGLYR